MRLKMLTHNVAENIKIIMVELILDYHSRTFMILFSNGFNCTEIADMSSFLFLPLKNSLLNYLISSFLIIISVVFHPS